MAGIFCSSLGQIDSAITSSPVDIFSKSAGSRDDAGMYCLNIALPVLISYTATLLHAQLPSETLCTENLTPFLKLLPCKGITGISGLMKPYVLLAHDWHAMGVDYTSSESDETTELVLWWEAVVNLVDWEKDAKRGGWIGVD
jgi:phosphatidylinositol glycan class T